MAYICTVGHSAFAVPGITPSEGVPEFRPNGNLIIRFVTGETVRPSPYRRIPGADIQRRAMELADLTGSQVSMTAHQRYRNGASETGRSWSIVPAKLTDSVPETLGWVVRLSENGDGFKPFYFRTWIRVIEFLSGWNRSGSSAS